MKVFIFIFCCTIWSKVASQKTSGDDIFTHITMLESSLASSAWSWHKEKVGIWGNNSFEASRLLEQINTTKDTTDFLWYSTR